MQNNVAEILNQFGLGETKARVYLTSLEMGRATAYAIAKRIGLKRPTVYDSINSLMKDGLLYRSIKEGVNYYLPADPERLLRKHKEREREIQSILPFLESLYNAPSKKPSIQYFEGEEGIKEMYEDSLRSLKKGDEILAYVGGDALTYLSRYSADYVSRRVEKGILLRGLYQKTPEIMKYMEKNREQLRVARVLEQSHFPVNNETNIYKGKVAIASYGKEMFGTIIASEEIYQSQKAIFELAWQGADKEDGLVV